MGLQINSKKLHIYNSMYDIYLAPLRGPEVGRWLSTCMDLIDLTQSDSENEREIAHTEKGFLSQTGPIEHVRKLPLWASASGSNSKRSVGISQRLPVSELYSRNDTGDTHEREERQLGSVVVNGNVVEEKALYIGNGDGSISSDNGYARRRLPPNFIGEGPFIKISGSGSGRNTQNLHGIEEASLGSQSRAFQSNGYPVSEAVDKPFTWHTSKRTIPHSFQPAVPTTGPQVPMDKRGDGLDFCGRTYHSVGVNEADRKAYEGDNLHVENDDVVLIYENGSTRRQLPPSVTHGKSVSTSRSTGFSDTSHRMGVGEERPKENDERLIFQAALQDLSQPKLEANLPDGLLIVPLLRHQRIALAWMVQKETNSFQCLGGILADDQGLGKTISTIALILMQRPLPPKSTSDASQHVKSEALNLDEDDDVVNDLERIKQHGKSDNHGKGGQQKVRPAAGTLVVCPASVLRQWARELEEKIAEGAKLSVLIYHGGARTKDPIELAGFDVVLTTYSIVSNEVPKQPIADDDDDDEQRCVERYGLSSEFSSKKRKKASNAGKKGQKGKKGIDDSSLDPDIGTLARVGWFRVVLDEAQTIKNHKTQVARACCGLRAKRRWCLSGTPIQNSIDDLYSYFRFLKYDPYAVYKSFCAAIKYPISRNATNGYKKLQAVLKTIMLRRTKGTLLDGEPIIKLPPKSISLKQVDFSAEERTFYSELEADSRQKFKAYAAAGTVKQNYANILLMLLRLRQACDHPLLVKNPHSDSDGKLSLEMARKLSRDTQISLLNHLEASLAICGICNDTPENAVVTICGHVFCYQCVCDRLVADDNLCPATYCKAQIGMDSIFFGSTLRRCISGHPSDNFASFSSLAEESEVGQGMYSSKIKAALEIVQSLCKSKKPSSIIGSSECEEIAFSPESTRDPALDTRVRIHLNSQAEIPEKAIIFSQWTKMLDLLEIPLKNSGIQYRRLDGTMSLAARDRAVKDYTTNPEVTVIIMSLKAGNLGLNMVAACHVLLLDLWWNPTTEDQAIDRAHRIGQTRPVTVSRLTIKDTVEDRILALQEDKRQMVASAFGEDQTGSHATRLTVEDLRYLFMV